MVESEEWNEKELKIKKFKVRGQKYQYPIVESNHKMIIEDHIGSIGYNYYKSNKWNIIKIFL